MFGFNQINYNADVVFAGAGPVALWTAVQAKLRDPFLQIDMFDKHPVYQRSHVLQINRWSLDGCPPDPRLQAIVEEFKNAERLRTNTIEERLSGLARELGIRIHKNTPVVDPSFLRKMYPKAKVFVGADGAHSTVRDKIFDNGFSVDTNLKFVVEVKYEVFGQGFFLDTIKQVYPTLKVMGTIAQEHVGSSSNGKTPVTLRIFIDKEKYEAMQQASFAHPFTLENEEQIHEDVLDNINLWFNIKKQFGEVRIPGSEKITVTRLGIYASREYAKIENGAAWVLVGDAAFGVPFFRSLNNGLLEGTELSKRIVTAIDAARSPHGKIINIFKNTFEGEILGYANYVMKLALKELLIARIKNFFLNFILWFVQISSYVPWQVNYWTEAQIQDFRAVRV